MRDFFINLQKVDRRWIYLAVAVACAVPFILAAIGHPIKLVAHPTGETCGVYNAIESIPRDKDGNAEKIVVIDTGWDAGSLGENMGQTQVVIDHLFRNRIPFITVDLGGSPFAPQFINIVIDKLHKERYPDRVYGKDWVCFGYYKIGGWQAYIPFAQDFSKVYEKECIHGWSLKDEKDLEKMPLMKWAKNIDNVHMIYAVTYSPNEEWVSFIHGIYGTPIAFGCAGIQSTTTYRFIPPKQLVGMLVSIRGSAEYDTLLYPNKPSMRQSKGTELLVPLAFGHLVIIAAVIIGNIGYFASRRRRN